MGRPLVMAIIGSIFDAVLALVLAAIQAVAIFYLQVLIHYFGAFKLGSSLSMLFGPFLYVLLRRDRKSLLRYYLDVAFSVAMFLVVCFAIASIGQRIPSLVEVLELWGLLSVGVAEAAVLILLERVIRGRVERQRTRERGL